MEIPGVINGHHVVLKDRAFDSNTTLTSVKIGDGITSLGEDGTFYGCTALEHVELPETLELVNGWAFQGCTSLTEIVIPDSVTLIKNNAFTDCTALRSVKLGSGLTRISASVFDRCIALEEIVLPDSLIELFPAFVGCTSLKHIEIPDKVTELYPDTFMGCTQLASVTLGKGMRKIAYHAFEDCPALTSIIFADAANWGYGDPATPEAALVPIDAEILADPAQAATLLTTGDYLTKYLQKQGA